MATKASSEIIFLIEESLEGGYEAKALGHSIYTQADAIDELKTNIREAVQCHFELSELPKVIRLHWVREEVISA
jgi:hypothetical protein